MTTRMKNTLIHTAVFVVGALVGCAATQLYFRNKYDFAGEVEYYDSLTAEEIGDACIEGLQEGLEEDDAGILSAARAISNEMYDTQINFAGGALSMRVGDSDDDEWDEEDEEDEMDQIREDLELDIELRRKQLRNERPNHQIVTDVFNDVEEADLEIFDDSDVLYYIQSDVFVDEDDDPIEDPLDWFGEEACRLTKMQGEDGEEVCVRHNRMEVIFHIHAIDDVYIPFEERANPIEGAGVDGDDDWDNVAPQERMRRMNSYKERKLKDILAERGGEDE